MSSVDKGKFIVLPIIMVEFGSIAALLNKYLLAVPVKSSVILPLEFIIVPHSVFVCLSVEINCFFAFKYA